MVYANFKGSTAEGHALVNAISHHCTCTFGIFGIRVSTCPAHDALLNDQVWLDSMLFERWRFAHVAPGAAQRVIAG